MSSRDGTAQLNLATSLILIMIFIINDRSWLVQIIKRSYLLASFEHQIKLSHVLSFHSLTFTSGFFFFFFLGPQIEPYICYINKLLPPLGGLHLQGLNSLLNCRRGRESTKHLVMGIMQTRMKGLFTLDVAS